MIVSHITLKKNLKKSVHFEQAMENLIKTYMINWIYPIEDSAIYPNTVSNWKLKEKKALLRSLSKMLLKNSKRITFYITMCLRCFVESRDFKLLFTLSFCTFHAVCDFRSGCEWTVVCVFLYLVRILLLVMNNFVPMFFFHICVCWVEMN